MTTTIIVLLLLIIVFFSTLAPSTGHEDCQPEVRCHPKGPAVRFPFRLKDLHHPLHCASYNPDFTLSCDDHRTILLLPDHSLRVYVTHIDYSKHLLHVHLPAQVDCSFPAKIHFLNQLSASYSFSFPQDDLNDWVIFSCPAPITHPFYHYIGSYEVTCLHDPNDHGLPRTIYAFGSVYDMMELPILSCKKIYNVSKVPYQIFQNQSYHEIALQWPLKICRQCEVKGKYCRLNHSKDPQNINDYECFGSTRSGERRKVMIIGLTISGLILLTMGVVAACYVKQRKLNDEARIEKFLGDYRALKPSRYSYADIKKITNDFEDKVGQGSYGIVYKGTLSKSNDVHVAVKMLNNPVGKSTEGQDFINEMGIMGKIHHLNIVRLVGYCADGIRRALIDEFLPNGSVEKLILSETEKLSLGWKKLETIAIGIAKGIEYLHQGCEQCILHFDIKPQNVLLDSNLVPKISDFGQAKLCSKEQSVVSMTTARGTLGYIAPEMFTRNFGSVSYKSDIYSFGMLLLGIVGGKKNNHAIEDTDQIYYPEWIYNQLNSGNELKIRVVNDGDDIIVRKLAIVGLWCIQWYPTDRPKSMKLVVQMLEGDGSSLHVPTNPFVSMNSFGITRGETSKLPFNSSLEVIME